MQLINMNILHWRTITDNYNRVSVYSGHWDC